MNRRLALLALAAASLAISACSDVTAPTQRSVRPLSTLTDSSSTTESCTVWTGAVGATCTK